jgi:hypothetical protein
LLHAVCNNGEGSGGTKGLSKWPKLTFSYCHAFWASAFVLNETKTALFQYKKLIEDGLLWNEHVGALIAGVEADSDDEESSHSTDTEEESSLVTGTARGGSLSERYRVRGRATYVWQPVTEAPMY